MYAASKCESILDIISNHMLVKNSLSWLILAVLLISPLVVAPAVVHACSCLPGDTDSYFKDAEYVFKGKAASLDLAEGEDAITGAGTNVITFDNVKLYKGESASESIEVSTTSQSASCGVNFEEGKTYMVYASESDGVLSTFLCSGTTELTSQNSSLENEVMELADGKDSLVADPYYEQPSEREVNIEKILNAHLNTIRTVSSSNLLFSIINTVLLLFVLIALGLILRPHTMSAEAPKKMKSKEDMK